MNPPKPPLDPKKPLDDNDAFRLGLLSAEDMLEGDEYDFGPSQPAKPMAVIVPEFSAEEIEKADFEAVVEAIELAGLQSGDASERSAPLIEWLANPASAVAVDRQYKADPGYVESLLLRLEGVRGVKDAAKRLRSDIKRRAKESAKAARRGLLRIAEPDEKAGTLGELFDREWPALYTPPGWILNQEGLKKQVQGPDGGIDYVTITRQPILVTGVAVDIETGSEALHLEWLKRNEWKSRVVRSSYTQDKKAFVETRDFGSPVSANNAAELSKFLDEFESCNALPCCYSTKKMGWVGRDGALGFVWGNNLIREDGVISALDLRPVDWGENWVRTDYDAGGLEHAAALHAEGTLAEWVETIETYALPFPAVMVGLYASIAAPFMMIIPAMKNIILDISGETSQGKTTAMRVAASVWGCPTEEGGIINTWDTTAAGLERLAEGSPCLPVFLDDTKRADKEMLGRFVYQLAQGKGRGRATPDGRRATPVWRSPFFSTGESPITSYCPDAAGAAARVISLNGSPFGANRSDVVEPLNANLLENYGHAGPAVVAYLLNNREIWPKLRQFYAARLLVWQERFPDQVGKRMAHYLVFLEIGQLALHEYLGVKQSKADVLQFAFTAINGGVEDTDKPKMAMRAVYEWCTQHSTDFWGRHDERKPDRLDEGERQPIVPHRGWAGAWEKDAAWKHIYFYPDVLDRVLEFLGFESAGVIRSWLERGWLTHDADRKTSKMKVNGQRIRAIALLREPTGADD